MGGIRSSMVAVGDVYFRLTVISRAGSKDSHRTWNCVCVCGTKKEVKGVNLTNGNVKSCGCWIGDRNKRDCITHGMSKSSEYRSWCGMRRRCADTNDPDYERYGGRGIMVCEEWANSFEKFFQCMGTRPEGNMSVDRINVNGNYEPGNCKWSTPKEQGRNRRSTKFATINGVTKCISEWAIEWNTNSVNAGRRLRRMGLIPKLIPMKLVTITNGE